MTAILPPQETQAEPTTPLPLLETDQSRISIALYNVTQAAFQPPSISRYVVPAPSITRNVSPDTACLPPLSLQGGGAYHPQALC